MYITNDLCTVIFLQLRGFDIKNISHEIVNYNGLKLFFTFDESAQEAVNAFELGGRDHASLLFDVRDVLDKHNQIMRLITQYKKKYADQRGAKA